MRYYARTKKNKGGWVGICRVVDGKSISENTHYMTRDTQSEAREDAMELVEIIKKMEANDG
jgi:hypothetical protein